MMAARVMSLMASLSPCPGQTRSVPATGGVALSSATAALGGATRCSRPAFMRSAGTVQRPLSESTSPQRAARTSPDRAAVRIRRADDEGLGRQARSAATKAGSAA